MLGFYVAFRFPVLHFLRSRNSTKAHPAFLKFGWTTFLKTFVLAFRRADAERFQLHALVPRQAEQGRVHLRLRALQRGRGHLQFAASPSGMGRSQSIHFSR